jgi:hypothetical protein
MQFRFLQTAFRALVQTLNQTTNEDYISTLNTKMAVFVVFVIVSLLGYLFFWAPFVNNMNQDVSLP